MRQHRPRYVVDTSVYVSGLLSTRGPSHALIESWRRGDCEFVVSPAVLRELRETVTRRDYPRAHIDPVDLNRLLGELRTRAELHRDHPVSTRLTRDPNDDYLEALRQRTRAQGVSLDRDLLALPADRGSTPFIRPEEALEHVRQRVRQRQQGTPQPTQRVQRQQPGGGADERVTATAPERRRRAARDER